MGFDQTTWKRPPVGSIQLLENTADVWLIPLQHTQTTLKPLLSILSLEEQASARQLVTQTLSDRFIIRRARLRTILSAYTGQKPERIQYHVNDYGKP
ncbi:MAG: hypothetical protein AAF125_19720, partial [Chloroflexota bacterium]